MKDSAAVLKIQFADDRATSGLRRKTSVIKVKSAQWDSLNPFSISDAGRTRWRVKKVCALGRTGVTALASEEEGGPGS